MSYTTVAAFVKNKNVLLGAICKCGHRVRWKFRHCSLTVSAVHFTALLAVNICERPLPTIAASAFPQQASFLLDAFGLATLT